LLSRAEEGNKAFSSALQLHDGLGKNWALWAEYLYCLFELDSNSTLGLSVVSCYLHACRSQKEAKCRKYLARIIWMLTHDDSKGTLAEVRV
jgi:transformation/transcription domain-associated protein